LRRPSFQNLLMWPLQQRCSETSHPRLVIFRLSLYFIYTYFLSHFSVNTANDLCGCISSVYYNACGIHCVLLMCSCSFYELLESCRRCIIQSLILPKLQELYSCSVNCRSVLLLL
jgi:hypothetical protein